MITILDTYYTLCSYSLPPTWGWRLQPVARCWPVLELLLMWYAGVVPTNGGSRQGEKRNDKKQEQGVRLPSRPGTHTWELVAWVSRFRRVWVSELGEDQEWCSCLFLSLLGRCCSSLSKSTACTDDPFYFSICFTRAVAGKHFLRFFSSGWWLSSAFRTSVIFFFFWSFSTFMDFFLQKVEWRHIRDYPHSFLFDILILEMWETWVQSLDWEDPLEKGKATHSSILA